MFPSNHSPFITSMYLSWKTHVLIERNQIERVNDLFTEYGLGLDKEKSHTNETAYASYDTIMAAMAKFSEI